MNPELRAAQLRLAGIRVHVADLWKAWRKQLAIDHAPVEVEPEPDPVRRRLHG